MPDLRYPIGEPSLDPAPSDEQRAVWIDQIAEAPDRFRRAVKDLSHTQFDTPYRGGIPRGCWRSR